MVGQSASASETAVVGHVAVVVVVVVVGVVVVAWRVAYSQHPAL